MSNKENAAGDKPAAGASTERPHNSTETQLRQIPNLQAALALADNGVSVIPCQNDKLPHWGLLPKRPDGKATWNPYKGPDGAIADEAVIRGWFENGNEPMIATAGGVVSGNLEILDFDDPPLFKPWCDLVESQCPGLIQRLRMQQTPSGGYHVTYRCPGATIGGNAPLARKQVGIDDRGKPIIKTMLETRGEGGYALTAPSDGYLMVQGGIADFPVITPEERDILLDAARSFNEYIKNEVTGGGDKTAVAGDTGLRPGDDYNLRGDWRPLVEADGWHKCHERQGVEYWRRPGKPRGISATFNAPLCPNGFYVFSTNASPFESLTNYSPFAVYTMLEHNGDFSAAARDLRGQGYGSVTDKGGGNGRKPMTTAVIVMPDNAPMPPLPEIARLPEGLGADASPWLDSYIELSRRWSPRAFDDFHEACALWLLSTVAARRVMLHFGGERFTNLYVALAARTSVYAKTTTAKIAHQTLQTAGLDWMLAADDSTPQAFIRGLSSRLPSDFDDLPPYYQEKISKRFALRGARGWAYEEFGEKLTAMSRDGGFMADFKGHLRRFDDCPQRYEYATIGRGHDLVERPYLALLANMTPADMKPLSRRGASMWGDGFWARFAFVAPATHERKRGRFPSGERLILAEITDPLRNWHERLGLPEVSILGDKAAEGEGMPALFVGEHDPAPCTLGAGVVDAFYNYGAGLLDLIQGGGNTDLDGNYSRFAEKALRVAILLASLENDNKIEMRHWARAQEIAERWRGGLHALYNQVTEADSTPSEQMEEKVLEFVTELGSPTANEVRRRIRGLDTQGAARILDVLADSGLLAKTKSKRSFRYSLPTDDNLTG